MPRHSGRSGVLSAQVGGGTPFGATALTNSGDGVNYTLPAALVPVMDVPAPTVKINGVLSGLEVTIDNGAANNTIDYTAGKANLKGLVATIAAGQVAALARPVANPGRVVNAIVLGEDGLVTNVAGTEGVAAGALGAAGGQPFIGTDKVLLGTVTFESIAAAPVVAAEIDNTGQERGDVPGFELDYFDGKVQCEHGLDAIHTAGATRKVWAFGRTATLKQVFHIESFDLELGKDTAETMAGGDEFKKSVPTYRNWSGSASGYHVSPLWFQLANRDGYVLMEFKTHKDDPYKFQGVANCEWSLSAPTGDSVKNSMTFTGNGELKVVPV